MLVIYGKIREVDYDNRIFSILRKNRIEYFYLSRNQMKRYSSYLYAGLFVYFRSSDLKKHHHHYLCYDVISFIKMMRKTRKGNTVFYDIDTIQEGVVKLLNQNHNRMFLDLEFTMPPFQYTKDSYGKEFMPEIIQYGIYIENKDGQLLDCDSALVKPVDKKGLNSRTYGFLNLGPNNFRKAISYLEFYNNLKYYMETYNPVIYVWGKNDMSVMENSYNIHSVPSITKRKDFINLMQVIKNYYSIKSDIGLFKAAELFQNKQESLQGHDALDDAYMTMKVFHLFKKEINNRTRKI